MSPRLSEDPGNDADNESHKPRKGSRSGLPEMLQTRYGDATRARQDAEQRKQRPSDSLNFRPGDLAGVTEDSARKRGDSSKLEDSARNLFSQSNYLSVPPQPYAESNEVGFAVQQLQSYLQERNMPTNVEIVAFDKKQPRRSLKLQLKLSNSHRGGKQASLGPLRKHTIISQFDARLNAEPQKTKASKADLTTTINRLTAISEMIDEDLGGGASGPPAFFKTHSQQALAPP